MHFRSQSSMFVYLSNDGKLSHSSSSTQIYGDCGYNHSSLLVMSCTSHLIHFLFHVCNKFAVPLLFLLIVLFVSSATVFVSYSLFSLSLIVCLFVSMIIMLFCAVVINVFTALNIHLICCLMFRIVHTWRWVTNEKCQKKKRIMWISEPIHE